MMKQLNIIILLVISSILTMVSCKKDGMMVVATQSTKPGLTATNTNLNYTIADSATNAVTFNYTPSDFGYSAAITYDLQLSANDSNFRSMKDITLTSNSISYLVKDFNTLLLGLKYNANVTDTLFVRVKATVADSLFRYSDTLSLIIKPYAAQRVITYPFLYVPGAYQGWSPTAAVIAKFYSPKSNNVYDGYVNIPDANSTSFKLTTGPSWTNNYGSSDGVIGGGVLASNASNNLTVAGAGYYQIHVDIPNLQWMSTLMNWGIIGDVNSWSGDISFDFDPVNQVLVKTLTLPAGQLKFRANGAWSINYGGSLDALGNVSLASNGGNIAVTVPGIYKITLDLRVPTEPICTMVKQ